MAYIVSKHQRKYHSFCLENNPKKSEKSQIIFSTTMFSSLLFLSPTLHYVKQSFMTQADGSRYYRNAECVPTVKKCLTMVNLAWKIFANELKFVFQIHKQCTQTGRQPVTTKFFATEKVMSLFGELICEYFFLKCRLADLEVMKRFNYQFFLFDVDSYVQIVQEIKSKILKTIPKLFQREIDEFKKFYKFVTNKYVSLIEEHMFNEDAKQNFFWNPQQVEICLNLQTKPVVSLMEMFQSSTNSRQQKDIASENVIFAINFYKNQFCHVCYERQAKLKKCGRCKKALYCSRICQKRDWTSGKHKTTCVAHSLK